MSLYRELDHDALLAVLQQQHKGNAAVACVAGVMLLAAAFFSVLGVGLAIEKVAMSLLSIRRRE